jgi:olefin beta-lactone synthetase
MTASAFVNIARHVPAMARARPLTLAIVEPHGRGRYLTFRELDAETDALAAGLDKIGVGRGVRTVLMVPPSLEFYTLTFALFKVGAVVVLIDPGMGIKNLGVCLKEAAPAAFIGVPKAHLARALLGWGRATLRTWVTVGPRFGWGGHTLAQVRRLGQPVAAPMLAPTDAASTAAILFTSGSTGVSKGVIYTHGIFEAQVESLRRLYGIEPGEVDLPTFPLFGLFGPALGMTAIIPEMNVTRPAHVNPVKIIEAIRHFGVTNLFGSPALIDRVGSYGAAHGVRLPTLRRVISAGAPVPAAVLETFTKMLAPGMQIHTPYGATEALPVCSIGSDEILSETRHRTPLGAGVCVGKPVAHMQVRIIGISDEPIGAWEDRLELPRGEIGEIVVQGPVVTAAYHNRPAATALAKIPDPQRGSLWHRMGDVGYLDDRGRVWFCGRKSQRVVTRARTYFTIPCEGVFNAHPLVFRTALVGVEREGMMQPVLCVQGARRPSFEDRRRAELLARGVAQPHLQAIQTELLALGAAQPHTRAIKTILFYPAAFPVDIRHNAKIFREKLAVWAAARLRGKP